MQWHDIGNFVLTRSSYCDFVFGRNMYGSGIIRMVCVRKWCRVFKFLNLCRGGTDISVCLEIMLKNNKIEVE